MGLARPTRLGDADGRRQRGCGEARARQTRGPARGRRLKPGGGGAGKGDGAGRSAAAGQAGVPDDRTRRQRGADRAAPPGAGPAAETETKTVRELSPVRRPRVQGPPHGGHAEGWPRAGRGGKKGWPHTPQGHSGVVSRPEAPGEQRELGCHAPSSPTAGTGTCAAGASGMQTANPWPPGPWRGGWGGCTGAGRGLGAAALCAVLRTLAPETRSQAGPGPSAGRRHTADERAAATMPPAATELAARHRASRGGLHGLGWGEPRSGRRRPGWAAL